MRLIQALKEIDLRHLAVIGASVAAMVTFMFTQAVFNDGDTYWHLASGRWIIEARRPEKLDVSDVISKLQESKLIDEKLTGELRAQAVEDGLIT